MTAAQDSRPEQVLVVPRAALEQAGLLRHGFAPGDGKSVLDIVQRSGFFADRPQAEQQPAWKQIIPYAVVACGGRFFLMQRSGKGGEPRLHRQHSIGVGGHVNPAGGGPVRLDEELRRELEEELQWTVPYTLRIIGTLNDDANAVGQVHFGLVYRVDAGGAGVSVRETELLSGRFVDAEELSEHLDRLETWSRCLAEFLLQGLVRAGSAP